jgi:hypothetical protein
LSVVASFSWVAQTSVFPVLFTLQLSCWTFLSNLSTQAEDDLWVPNLSISHYSESDHLARRPVDPIS